MEAELEMVGLQLPYFTPTHLPQSGSFTAPGPGTLFLRFANEASIPGSKTHVHFSLALAQAD